MLIVWYCVQAFLFPLVLCLHSLKKRIISPRQASSICLVFATGQKRRKANLLFCWTHGKGTSGMSAMTGCPLHTIKMVNIPSVYCSIYNLLSKEVISFAQEYSREYVQGTLRMLISLQPCSSWSLGSSSSDSCLPSSSPSPRPIPLLCFPLFPLCWHFAFPIRPMFAYFYVLLICKCFCL